MKRVRLYGPMRSREDATVIEIRKVVLPETGEHFQVFRRTPDIGVIYKTANIGNTNDLPVKSACVPLEIVTSRQVIAAIHRAGHKLNGKPLGRGVWAKVYCD